MAKYILIALTIALAAFVAPIRAEDWENLELADDASTGRILISTNTSVSSFTPDARSILVAILVVVLGYAVFSPVFASQSGSGRNDYYNNNNNQNYDQYGYDQSQFYSRSDEVQQNLAAKMLQLEALFKKFDVQEEECKTYVACEAAQNAERVAQNGALVQQVRDIFSEGNDFDKHEELKKLKAAYDDSFARRQEYDACGALRRGCEGARSLH